MDRVIPRIAVKQLLQWQPRAPSGDFKFRLRQKFADVAKTKIGHRLHMGWKSKRLRQFRRIDNAHPTHPDTFCACGQPEVLHGQAGAEEIGFQHRMAAKHVRTAALAIAGIRAGEVWEIGETCRASYCGHHYLSDTAVVRG